MAAACVEKGSPEDFVEWSRDDSAPKSQSINEMLAERETRYGSFETFAKISQDLTKALHQGNWDNLSPAQAEALEMGAHKVARILNGDPNYLDNWVDLCGYSQLVVNILESSEEPNAKT